MVIFPFSLLQLQTFRPFFSIDKKTDQKNLVPQTHSIRTMRDGIPLWVGLLNHALLKSRRYTFDLEVLCGFAHFWSLW